MKYKSEIYEALHEETIADFKVGAISETELLEFEKMCFVKEDETEYKVDKPAESAPQVMEHITA